MSDEINELPLEIEVEDVSNEDVDIVEDAQEYEVQESDTVDIQASEEEPVIIEVEETMGWAGGDSGAHSSLYGRDYPDQHPISAITGLSEKLSDIEALKSVQSNKLGHANYYKWANNERRDEYGYFVSLMPHSETITICNGGDIFGVTVPFAGFVGGQDEVKRGNDYALVATSGVVTVRCESNVDVNDYVVSNAYGIATKTTSGCGYKVITVDAPHDVYYASISLGVQACTTDILGKNLQTLDTRISDAETNIAAAMNTANAAYKKAVESISSNESMKDQIDDALGKVDDMETDIKNIGDQVSDVSTISAQAKAIAESAATFAESARNEAVVTANEALSKAGEIEATVEPISNWKYTDPVTGETNTGATYFAEYVKNGLSTKAEMETVSRLDEENKLLIEKNAESYLQMLSSVDKYSVGEYSQAYGLTAEQAKNILKVGMIYIPTEDHIEPLFANGEREVFRNALYVWGGESWGGETLNIVWLGSNNPGSSYKYWYTELDEAEEGYEPHTLYINNDGEWVEVATLAGNVNNRITSMIRQDVDSITMEIVNARGSFASINARVSENETNISNIAAWVERGGSNISAIEQSADENGATMALVVAHNEEAKTLSGASIVLGTGENPSYISLSADAINLEGVVTANGTFQINTDGSMIATGGDIGGFKINDNAIYSVADTSKIGYGWNSIYMDSYNSITPKTSLWNGYFYDADNNPINRNYVYVGTDGIGTCRIEDYDEEHVCKDGNLSDDNLVRTYMSNGKLYAEDAEITGKISATGGDIGGWEITSSMIKSSDIYLNSGDSIEYPSLVSSSKGSSIRIGYGNIATPNVSNFLLLQDGSLYAKYVDISGKISTKSGSIGGWSISNGMINKSNIYLNADDNKKYKSLLTEGQSPIRISINEPSTPESCTFMLLDDGSLYTNAAEIKGVLTATTGSSIGNFIVQENGNLLLETTENLSNVFKIHKEYNSVVSETILSTGSISLSRTKDDYTNYIQMDCASNSFPVLKFGYHGVNNGITFKQEGADRLLVCGNDASNFLIYDCGFGVQLDTEKHIGITGQIKVGNKYMRIDKGIITGISDSSYSGYTDLS